ncbi:MAG TPA: type II secretion system F family protein, partial [Fimbriimonadaceae bacterium]|nr:type II secretion system F family protein [Fimbriimonadaceae bacterium]
EPSGTVSASGGKRVSEAEAARTLDNLAVMMKTGVPFVEALEAAANSTRNPRMSDALKQIREDVIGGQSLSGAMRNTGGVFPPLVADMVRVAEEGGRLDLALRSASIYMERAADLKRRIKNAMMYPCVMLGVSVITVAVLVLFVVPRFSGIFSKSGVEVPATTQALLALSAAAHKSPLMVLLVLGAIIAGIIFALRLPVVRTVAGRVLFKTPVVGALLRQLAISRAVQSIATLLSSNVPLLAALEHGAKVSGYPPIGDALIKARNDVEHGSSLSDSLKDSQVFPAMLVQLVTVGERSGQLSALLQSGSESMETEVDARLKALVSIVEPLMIVFMGVVVGGITLSIITPIYNVVQNIK